MFASLFKKSTNASVPQQIYGGLMTHARSPLFFETMGVPDTVMGRFDMLAMHVYLLARRLKNEPDTIAGSLGQDIFDLFVADVERALRQLGIGDTTVPKRKKKLIHSFYAQIDDFDPPLDKHDTLDLQAKVKARYLNDAEKGDAKGLADYMIKTDANLQSQSLKNIMDGQVSWTIPA